jgi:hypothetical protein
MQQQETVYCCKAKVGKPAPDFTMFTTADMDKLQSKVSLSDCLSLTLTASCSTRSSTI